MPDMKALAMTVVWTFSVVPKYWTIPLDCWWFSPIILKSPHKCIVVLFQHWPYRLHKPDPFFQNSFISEILRLCLFFPYLISVTESTWKCVTALVKKNVSVKILPHTHFQAGKVRKYFSRCNNFRLKAPGHPLSLSLSLTQQFLT